METRVSRGSIALVAVLSTIGTSCKGCKTNGGDSAADPETGGHDLDSDNDRLMDWDERNVYSTDPLNPDTDGDGWNDGDEVLDHGTSPTNPYSHPYTGDYKVGDCADYPDKSKAHPNGSRTVEAEGGSPQIVPLYEPGDTVANEQLIDQYGEKVDLFSFCGVNFDLFFIPFNQLSGPPEYAALSCWIQDMVNVQNYYRDYGYQLIIVLTQNNDTELPTTNDIQAYRLDAVRQGREQGSDPREQRRDHRRAPRVVRKGLPRAHARSHRARAERTVGRQRRL